MNYVDKIAELNEVLECIDEVYKNICKTDMVIAYEELSKEVTGIARLMTEFMEKIELFRQYDIEIPHDVLLAQLQNLLEGYENRDYVMLADTLHYEITDSLSLYLEILREFQKENIQIS